MSSPLVSAQAASGRPFYLEEAAPERLRKPPATGSPLLSSSSLLASSTLPASSAAPSVLPASSPHSLSPALPAATNLPSSSSPPRPQVAGVTAASQLWLRPALAMAPSGIAQLDALTGGFPRGGLTEIYGPSSSGRTSLLLTALAAATGRGELCVLVDVSDAFHPGSAAGAGLDLGRLLWVRCGEKSSSHALARNAESRAATGREKPLEQMLRVTDLLLQSGGFGMVALDLGDVAPEVARRVPLTSWFRFRRAVEHTSTLLLVMGQQPCARTCASLLFHLQSTGFNQAAQSRIVESAPSLPAHAQLLNETQIHAELLCSRLERKPSQSAGITFATHAAWAG